MNELHGAKVENNPLGFILSSNGIAYTTFSLKSLRTGKHFTYKVKKAEPRPGHPDTWFVKYLFGPDNTADYCYMGMIRNNEFRITTKFRTAELKPETPVVKALVWTLRRLAANQNTPNLEVWHAGKCGRCGRALTVPESVALGFGPECANKVF